MTKSLKLLMCIAMLTACAVSAAPSALGAETCPNETLRAENNSTALPDCRAYELVSPDVNHAFVAGDQAGLPVAADGSTVMYDAFDAPANAQSGQPAFNFIRAGRDSATGWKGVSLSPPVLGPITGYWSFRSFAVSSDLSATFDVSTQPLAGGLPESGYNVFIGHADGTYRSITPIPQSDFNASFVAGNADFTHVYFRPDVAQLPEDHGNVYSWTEASGLHLVGVLPDGTPAPGGVSLAGGIIGPISADATRAVFMTNEKLYLRMDDERTVEVSKSRRTTEPDPNPIVAPVSPELAGISASGSKVLFVARSELTDDANTGSSGGVATDAGADLYSYDVASGDLTDLTVDNDPADAATGANVQQVRGAAADGSYVYFIATGKLATGAISGHASLYVWHEGEIDFVADAQAGGVSGVYVTPDGRHVVLSSTASLTGYDNRDPVTMRPHLEVFEVNLGLGVECVSCRVDGTRPTADSDLPVSVEGPISVASDDGRRVFFESTDAIVQQTPSGLHQLYEYEGGAVAAISRLGSSSSARMLAASPSGNDVFFTNFDNPVPGPTSGGSAVFDARVGGGFPAVSRHECAGAVCHGPASAAPVFDTPASTSFPGVENPASPAPKAKAKTAVQIRAEKLAKALKACKRKAKKRRLSCEKSARKNYRSSR